MSIFSFGFKCFVDRYSYSVLYKAFVFRKSYSALYKAFVVSATGSYIVLRTISMVISVFGIDYFNLELL